MRRVSEDESHRKTHVVIYGASQQSLNLFLVIICAPEGVAMLHVVLEPTHDREFCQWMRELYADT